ncbi:MAG: hypothetical protein ACFFAX_00170 [Promethearchaeota archaeon]
MAEEGSRISRRLKRTGELLLGGAKQQVTGYKSRFDSLNGIYDEFLSGFINQYPEGKADPSFVDRFFGKRELSFAGIDGTICKYDVFDLIIFFAGAYSSHGIARVDDSGNIELEYEEQFLERGIGLSSVLPIYINEVPLVDQTILARAEDGSVDHTVAYTDSWIIDNSAFADYMMTLSEFYLAYRLVSGENPVDILLMDRVCSSEISSSYAETSDFRIDIEKECGLVGQDVNGRPFSATEWIQARRLLGNLRLGTPPARGEYLLPRIMAELSSESSGLTREEISARLGIDSEPRRERLDKELESAIRGKGASKGIVVRKGKHFSLRPEYRDLRKRLETLVVETCERLFSEDPTVTYDERFKVDKRWLTTNDLSFLALASLYLTIERSWQNKTLLIGVAKDTSARDFKRQVMPVLNHLGICDKGFFGEQGDTPDTDRMILQWVSLQERERLKTPWATIEYDTAFKTIVPHFDRKSGLVSGARRNQISLEKTFVKAYFQLCEAKSNPRLRSNVLLYDRLVHPEFDDSESTLLELKHDYESKPEYPEPIEAVFYYGAENPIQSFTIALFKAMTSASIPELFGHLKPLYVADKVAKYNFTHFKNMVESAGSWLINRPELREFLFYLTTFRERRSDVEQSRRGT